MPEHLIHRHARTILTLSAEIAGAGLEIGKVQEELVADVGRVVGFFETSSMRHVHGTDVVSGLGTVEVFLEEALRNLEIGDSKRALRKCHIALRVLERTLQLVGDGGSPTNYRSSRTRSRKRHG